MQSGVYALAGRFARLLLGLTSGCGSHTGPTGKPEAPAKVEKLPQETEIRRITLTEDAERRLGITLGRVTREHVQRRRTFGGDVMIPAGQTIIVSAPVAGTLAPPDSTTFRYPANMSRRGLPVMTLAATAVSGT